MAGSAFIATTQILTGVRLDLPLYVALVAFAINIPFQIIIFLVPHPLTIKDVNHLLETKATLTTAGAAVLVDPSNLHTLHHSRLRRDVLAFRLVARRVVRGRSAGSVPDIQKRGARRFQTTA